MLRLIASRHDDDDADFIYYLIYLLLSLRMQPKGVRMMW